MVEKDPLENISDELIENWFGGGTNEKDIPSDGTVNNVRRTRALILFWHQINTEVTNAREGFNLARIWKDEELKKKYLEQGKQLFKRATVIENELKDSLIPLRGVNFLTPDELSILPKWVGEALKKE